MSFQELYKETIGYDWVLAKALDRVAEARARLHGRLPRAEFMRRAAEYRAAVISLYMLLPPRVRNELPSPEAFDVKALDKWVADAVALLDRAGLLLRQRRIMVGGEIEV